MFFPDLTGFFNYSVCNEPVEAEAPSSIKKVWNALDHVQETPQSLGVFKIEHIDVLPIIANYMGTAALLAFASTCTTYQKKLADHSHYKVLKLLNQSYQLTSTLKRWSHFESTESTDKKATLLAETLYEIVKTLAFIDAEQALKISESIEYDRYRDYGEFAITEAKQELTYEAAHKILTTVLDWFWYYDDWYSEDSTLIKKMFHTMYKIHPDEKTLGMAKEALVNVKSAQKFSPTCFGGVLSIFALFDGDLALKEVNERPQDNQEVSLIMAELVEGVEDHSPEKALTIAENYYAKNSEAGYTFLSAFASALIKCNQKERADQLKEKIITLAPDPLEAAYYLEKCDPKKALEQLKEAIKLVEADHKRTGDISCIVELLTKLGRKEIIPGFVENTYSWVNEAPDEHFKPIALTALAVALAPFNLPRALEMAGDNPVTIAKIAGALSSSINSI